MLHFNDQEIEAKALRPGDLLVCEGGDIGRAAIWNGELELCSFQNHLHRLRPKDDHVVPRFVMYYLQAGFTQLNIYEGAGNKTTIPNLSRSRLAALQLPLPPKPEQQNIAAVLWKMQRAIATQDRLIAATRNLKQSAMQRLFTHGLRGETLKETEVGQMPESWHVAPLGDCLKQAQYGMSMKGQKVGKYPILRMNCQVEGATIFRDLQYVDIDDKTFSSFQLIDGDLLFNRTNSYELVGRMSIVLTPADTVFASYLIRLTLDRDHLDSTFINYYFNQASTQLDLRRLASRGVSQSNISASKLRTYPVPVPPLAEQHAIAAALATIDRKLAHHQRKRTALNDLFQTTLHQLMTAQIRVADLDIDTSEIALPQGETA